MDRVLIVPGWGSPRLEWKLSPIPGVLRECGFDVEIAKLCERGRGDINHYARTIKQDMFRDGSLYNTHIIGHSLGGLIAMEVARIAYPLTVVTIGTPHSGTAIARFAPKWVSVSASQMSPSSEFIQQNQKNIGTLLFCIAATKDSLIWPRTSAFHPHADRKMWTWGTHLGAIMSRNVANEIKNYLISSTDRY